MTTVHLWFSPGACSLAPHILLKEIEIPFETTKLNVRAGFPEEFRHLNPKMRVPVLSLNGEIITENPAVMTAISQLCPGKHLMGETQLETIRVYEWMNWLSGTLHGQAFGGLWRAYSFSDDASSYDAIRAKSQKTIAECFDDIERKLSAGHAVGERFTAVDAFLFVFYRWGFELKFDMRGKYPKYTALAAEMVKRKSVQAALTAEGLKAPASLL